MRLPDHINQREVLALMVEHARNAMMVIGKGRRPIYANQAFLDMSGYTFDEWMTLEMTSPLSPERDLADSSSNLNRALQGEATEFRPRPILRKDGNELWVEACLTSIPVGGERFLLAEFRPPYDAPPDGASAWRPAGPGAPNAG
jgi:PAS domain S-box-containing protein